tara:strand:- start:688 stop:7314 length:6627 start_codon:yes stop_codon:yes gene_type:complete
MAITPTGGYGGGVLAPVSSGASAQEIRDQIYDEVMKINFATAELEAATGLRPGDMGGFQPAADLGLDTYYTIHWDDGTYWTGATGLVSEGWSTGTTVDSATTFDEYTDAVFLRQATAWLEHEEWVDGDDEQFVLSTGDYATLAVFASQAIIESLFQDLDALTESSTLPTEAFEGDSSDPFGSSDDDGESSSDADGGVMAAGVVVSCGEEPVVEEEPACPPPCEGDPAAITPNWTRLTEKEPFLNGKTCEYSIVLKTTYDATGIENLYSDPDYLTEGIEKLLKFYGKDHSEESIQACIDDGAIIKDTFVSTRSYVKMKALVVIPYDALNSIEDEAPADLPDRKDQPAFVVIKGADFLKMVKQTTRGMNIMASRQAEWFWNSGGRLSDPTFNPTEEARHVTAFKNSILRLFRENDFRIKKPANFAKKWIEEFEVGFNADMGVDYVKALEKGCEKPELLAKGFEAFAGAEPQTLPRTMYFASKLPEMWNRLTSQEPIEYADWVVEYTASPPITIEIENEESLTMEPVFCSDSSTSAENNEGAFNIGDEFAELGKSIMDEIKSFPDAYAKRFGDTMCAALEGKQKNDVSMKDLDMLAARAADAALRDFFAGDAFLEKIPEWLAGINDADDLYDNILDHLGLCGLLSLLESAFKCLMAGLSFEDFQKEMIKSAFKSMSNANFQIIFIGLPPDVKAELYNTLSAELQSIPPPWDADYRAGSYSGQGTTVTINPDRSPNVAGDTFQSQVTESGFDSTYAEEGSELADDMGEGGVIVGATTGVVIDERAIGRSYGNAGSIGTAADNISDAIVAAYRDAMLNWISAGSIEDLDMLGDALSKIPGAGIVTSILDQMDCPPLPWFTPPLGNFLQTLELGICPGHFAITLPRFTLNVSIGDIWAIIVNVAKELIKELVVKLIVLILKKILEIIFEALCALLGMIGAPLVEALTGGNQIKEAIGESLCSDATDEEIDEAVRQMMEATGLSNCSDPSQVPTTEDAAEFVQIIAAVLTNSEVLDLLSGNATEEVKQMITDVVNERIPNLSCMQPSDLAKMFSALGKIVSPEIIEQAQMIEGSLPVCDSICASPSQLDKFRDIRCQIMQDKGLTPEQCEEQLDSLTERAKQDLAELAGILQGGPFQDFPPLTGGDCPATSELGAPFAPGSSIVPDMPQEVADVAKDAVARVFENISNKHLLDLVGKRGFFDMILSDSNGAGLKEHKDLVRSFLGESNTADLNVFQFYTDNWIDEEGSDVEDASPSFNQNRGSVGSWGSFVDGDVGTGGFPLYVASRLQCYFAAYNQDYDFQIAGKKRLAGSKAITTPMRGSSIEYDYSDPTSNSCRGLPWLTDTDERYELVKKLELNYEDYSIESDEGYAMRIEAKTALKEAGSDWDATNRSEIVIYEKFGTAVEEEAQRLTVTSEITSGAQSLIDSLNIEPDLANMPLDAAVFGEHLASVIKGYNDYSGASTGDMKTELRSALPYLQDVYMRKLSLLLASNSQGSVNPAPRSYSYGYETESNNPVAVYMGGPDVSDKLIADNPDWFTGTGKLESEQAKIFERFGGSYFNPPYYMEPPARSGYLGMMDKFVPSPDACDPVDGSEPREPVCKFEDLADVYTDLMTEYKDDQRLFIRPGSSCGGAVPFNEIFTRGGAAGVDSTILATLRIHITDAILRGTPIFSVYGSECFDEILSSYIVKSIEEGLRVQPVWGLPTQNYYYLFMEQVVQMYGRQVDHGLIPKPEEGSALQQALDYLNILQTEFEPPVNIKNIKAYKLAYQTSRNEVIYEALKHEADTGEPGIRTILSYLILQEFKNISKNFEDSLYPSGMPVPTVPSVMFGNASFTQGASDSSDSLSWASSIQNVWNGKGGSEGVSGTSNVFEDYLWQSSTGLALEGGPYPSLAQGWYGTGNGVGNTPFRLEKYVRLNQKASYDSTISDIVEGREDRFKGIVSPESLPEWLSSLADQSMSMSELFDSAEIGYRLVFTTSPSKKGNQDWSGADSAFNLAIAINGVVGTMTDTQIYEKTLKVPVNKSAYSAGSTYVPPEGTDYMYMIPVAKAEVSIDLSGPVSGFSTLVDESITAEHSCLLDTLAASDEYQAMFGVSVPLKKMLSLLAIYTINNFLPSIGWREDGWAKEGGAWMGTKKGFRSWDQKTFQKSKREAKKAFMQFYHSTDPTYEDEDQKAEKKRLRMSEKPEPSGNPGWRWWRLSRKIRKPTDKNGAICP